MSIFLRWWLLFCLSITGAILAYSFGFFEELVNKDMTKISFVILLVYLVTSIYVGYQSFPSSYYSESGINFSWFITELLLALGMIGTVTGFILMLGSSFESLDVANIETVKEALTDMALGMSTALYTTLVGLICSQLLKAQLVNVEK